MSDDNSGNESSSSGGRVSGVSSKILEILGAGAKSTSDLISEGGFSSAAAFLNLKKLKEQGAVETERAGRIVYYRLADAAAAIAEAPRRGRKKGSKNKVAAKKAGKTTVKTVIAGASGSLSAALASIAERFSPVDDLQRKLEVLDQLAKSLPREVSSVLKDIRSDLVSRSRG